VRSDRLCAAIHASIPMHLFSCIYTHASIFMHLYPCIYFHASIPMHLFSCIYTHASIFMHLYPCIYTPSVHPSTSAQPPARPPQAVRGAPPPSRTDWTRLVPPPVLTGHVSSLPTQAVRGAFRFGRHSVNGIKKAPTAAPGAAAGGKACPAPDAREPPVGWGAPPQRILSQGVLPPPY